LKNLAIDPAQAARDLRRSACERTSRICVARDAGFAGAMPDRHRRCGEQ
jgi:hypothetical protein